jgi:uncharacterized membrane protein YedE/YeeE
MKLVPSRTSSAFPGAQIGLLISVTGFAVIKWTGFRSESAFVSGNFGLGGLVGGFILGFGMLLTGRCGSGSIWRAAEGQVKLMLALVAYATAASWFKSPVDQQRRNRICWAIASTCPTLPAIRYQFC